MKIKWKTTLEISALLVLILICTNLFINKTVSGLIKGETSDELVNYSILGMSLLDANYPGSWRLDGENLYKGDILINENYKVLDELSENTGILATIFAGDTRISTTVKDENGTRKIGTKVSDIVIDKVLKKDEVYQGIAVVVDANADAYYIPLHDESGAVVGIWFVGIYSDVVQGKIKDVMNTITGLQLLFLIIGSIAAYFGASIIAKGFIHIKGNLARLENGDFNIQFNMKLAKRKDEIGDITQSFINMQKKISDIISSIKEEASNIESSSTILAEGANNVYIDVEDISATTEELSAGMEETAASTEEMNATSISIEEEISRVSDKAIRGKEIASEIKDRAENLKEVAFSSQKTAVEIYENANKKMRESINKAGAIEEIKALSKTILSITAQTNLLALNAAIESARAGEAGKGFAVVANEIGILAKNSKIAVSKIDEISNEISDAVADIVADSELLLNFMDSKVIKDYAVLVQTGEQYHNDANTVDDMVTDIKNSTSQLNESIHYIRQAIDEVTLSSEECSKGSVDIALKSNSIFHKTNQVLDQANTNKEIASHLHDMVQFFKL